MGVSVHALAWLRLLPDCLLGGCVVAVAIASAAPLPDVSSQCSIVMRPILAELLLRHCGLSSVVCPFHMGDKVDSADVHVACLGNKWWNKRFRSLVTASQCV